MFELGQRDETEVAALRQATGLDAGYLSRLLARFEDSGLVRRDRSGSDARRQVIRLTTKGRDAFRVLDTKSVGQIRALLADLTDDEQDPADRGHGHDPQPDRAADRPAAT